MTIEFLNDDREVFYNIGGSDITQIQSTENILTGSTHIAVKIRYSEYNWRTCRDAIFFRLEHHPVIEIAKDRTAIVGAFIIIAGLISNEELIQVSSSLG